MKTLQEQYNLIKEGKGHKGIFLTEAKKQFPNMLTNPMGFDVATKILKTRGVISENYVDLKPINTIEASSKAAWETKFANFINEFTLIYYLVKNNDTGENEVRAGSKTTPKNITGTYRFKTREEAEKKAKELDLESINESKKENIKVNPKKPAKEVEEIQSHNYNYKDKSNLDNQIGQEVLNGIYFEAKENPDKTLDEIREIVAKNLAKDGQHYIKNAAFGVKGLGYKETEVQEVAGKHKSSGYSDKLKKMVKESLVKEYEHSYELVNGQCRRYNDEGEYTVVSMSYCRYNEGKKEEIDENSFEDKMAQLRALKDKQRMGQAPSQKVSNKKQTLQQKLNMLKRAYFDLISDMEKESDLTFAASEDWYQEQLDDMENSISDLEKKIQSINENAIGIETVVTNEAEEAEPKAEKKKVKKESLDADLAEIVTQAGIVAMEAKLDKISEMISAKMERLGMIEEDANLADLVDKVKVKEMQKEIKILEKRKAKMEKIYEKMTGKAYTKEMVDETMKQDSDTSYE